MTQIKRTLKEIALKTEKLDGRLFYVGGCVRDRILGIDSKDIDIEVYGIYPDRFAELLENYGSVDFVGKSFGVLRVKGLDVDFTMPRTETKIGNGHKGFTVLVNPFMPHDNACKRRDFTMNAILIDVLNDRFIDPFDGKSDIEKKAIRHIDDKTFSEDPLRVYRAAQFTGRLGFTIDDDTLTLMSQADLEHLSKERIYEEFKKLLLKSEKPSLGLRYLQEVGVIKSMHPLLHNMIDCKQDPIHHPEGDVWEHTLCVVDEASKLRNRSKDPTALMFASLVHDIGKPSVTRVTGNNITAHGHNRAGERLAEEFMLTLTDEKELIRNITALTKEHMVPCSLYGNKDNITDGALRRFSRRIDIDEVLLLAEADNAGRGVEFDFSPVRDWFETNIKRLSLDHEIKPIVMGRDLIEKGYKPSPLFGKVLNYAFELQLDGEPRDSIMEKTCRKIDCQQHLYSHKHTKPIRTGKTIAY